MSDIRHVSGSPGKRMAAVLSVFYAVFVLSGLLLNPAMHPDSMVKRRMSAVLFRLWHSEAAR